MLFFYIYHYCIQSNSDRPEYELLFDYRIVGLGEKRELAVNSHLIDHELSAVEV